LPASILFEGNDLVKKEYEELIKEYAFEITWNQHVDWVNDEGGAGYLTIRFQGNTRITGMHYASGYREFDDSYFTEYRSPYYIRKSGEKPPKTMRGRW
jgi:hypothetical protein